MNLNVTSSIIECNWFINKTNVKYYGVYIRNIRKSTKKKKRNLSKFADSQP